jgi:hypothetical protein
LTDAEKDIEQEIKSTEVEPSEIVSELVSWIYDDIIKINKIRYAPNKQSYPFARKLDDVIVKGRDEDLALNIITPLNSLDYDEDRLIHKSLADSDLILALSSSYDFISDLELYVKTKKYIPQKQGGNISESEKNLLFNKASDNNKRREKLQTDLKEFLSLAKIYHNGNILDIAIKDIKTKIENAFEILITNTYTHISLLPKVYEERDIHIILNQSDDLLTGSDDALTPAEQEMYNYIQRQKNSHKVVTISELLEYFQSRPYGWYQNAVLSQIALLFVKQKVDLKLNSTLLGKKEVITALTNNRQFNTIVVPRVEVDSKKIKQTKDILIELYPEASFNSTSTRDIIDEAMSQTASLIKVCKDYMNLDYPFKNVFQEIIDHLKKIERLTPDNFFEEIPKMEDDLLDMKEDLLDPIMEFMNGDKRKIYDDVINFIKENQNNLRYIDDPQKDILENLSKIDKPYLGNHIPKAKQALKDIRNILQPLIEQTKKEAISKVEAIITELQNHENFEKVPQEERYKIIRPRQNLITSIENTFSIDTIKQLSSPDTLDEELNSGIEMIYELIPQEELSMPKQDRVRISKLMPKDKLTLKNSDDVNEYIDKLRENLLNEINNGKQVLL